MSAEEKLLSIHKYGLYTTFTPEQISSTYLLLINYLRSNINSIDSIKYYDLLELQFYLSLLSNKDHEAKTCLDRIMDKFGDGDSQRTAILKATYLEATAGEKVAIEYLSKRKSDELVCLKKRIALGKSKATKQDYIKSLIGYLNVSPLDTEVWFELSETYVDIGHYEKAVFALQEILLVFPFAYNIFARIGELENIIYKKNGDLEKLESSLKHFLRSIELSSNFIRGWSGILITTGEFKKLNNQKPLKNVKIDYESLFKLSNSRLQKIISTKGTNKEDLFAGERIISTFT
ncbi:Tetratricopeptide repeat protein [Wickerhamomyces ciferrii]|uniref:ER membrane protein complex subunit 2 n=1 Tax=Wickerhamomyces ciferrii (strain ATCC 14091 / BCRC 22168 / CBS 111 / JCM 3599 / NBRC 0793 / NRRL Y-1031 F-60-10) TaxID=1206466 RepID=K0KHV5_WICCF|nr:Tetratricopeptide repeat protein [Wickerhamomyces ciferrii]CCH42601.1 Tetratricopeptide repeat protein [Wickerhamomyces ciferrii]